jgi:APA family basic amino acid/polyamine antiporter
VFIAGAAAAGIVPAMSEASRAPAHNNDLLRILGVGFGIAISIGAIIGSGILRAPSAVAAEVPSPMWILGLWLLGGIQAALSANMFAELGAALPRSGGIYVLAHRAFGDVGGLIVGWSDWLATVAANAAASVSFAEFFALVVPQAAGHKIAVALALQGAIYATNLMGLRRGRSFQIVTSFIKSAMLFVFIVAAVLVAAPSEPHVAPLSQPAFGLAGAVLAYKLIFGAYAGWTMPVNFSGENVNAARSIPRAIFLGIVVTMFLFVGVNAALIYSLGAHGVAATPLPFTRCLRISGERSRRSCSLLQR